MNKLLMLALPLIVALGLIGLGHFLMYTGMVGLLLSIAGGAIYLFFNKEGASCSKSLS